MDYVDMYLIHMPFSFYCNENSFSPAVNEDGTFRIDFNHNIIETWRVRIKLSCDSMFYQLLENSRLYIKGVKCIIFPEVQFVALGRSLTATKDRGEKNSLLRCTFDCLHNLTI